MIDIETGISPICDGWGRSQTPRKWSGNIALKGGEDESVLHWRIESQSPVHIVKTQICLLESMKDAIEKRIRLLESSLRN